MNLRILGVLTAVLVFVAMPAFGSRAHKNSRVRHYNHHVKYHHVHHNSHSHHKLG